MGALTFDALLRSLKQGAPDPVYYLHGEEDVLKDEAVRVLVAPRSSAATARRPPCAHARGGKLSLDSSPRERPPRMAGLTVDALLRSLKQGAPDPVYYLRGEEDVLKDEAVRVLLDRAV